VVSPCIINYARRMGKDIVETYRDVKTNYSIIEENRALKDNELGIVKNEKD